MSDLETIESRLTRNSEQLSALRNKVSRLETERSKLKDLLHREKVRLLIGKTAAFRPGFGGKIQVKQFRVHSVQRTCATIRIDGEESPWSVPITWIKEGPEDMTEQITI